MKPRSCLDLKPPNFSMYAVMLAPADSRSLSERGKGFEGFIFLYSCCWTCRKYWLVPFARSCCIFSLFAAPRVLKVSAQLWDPWRSITGSPPAAMWATKEVIAADCCIRAFVTTFWSSTCNCSKGSPVSGKAGPVAFARAGCLVLGGGPIRLARFIGPAGIGLLSPAETSGTLDAVVMPPLGCRGTWVALALESLSNASCWAAKVCICVVKLATLSARAAVVILFGLALFPVLGRGSGGSSRALKKLTLALSPRVSNQARTSSKACFKSAMASGCSGTKVWMVLLGSVTGSYSRKWAKMASLTSIAKKEPASSNLCSPPCSSSSIMKHLNSWDGPRRVVSSAKAASSKTCGEIYPAGTARSIPPSLDRMGMAMQLIGTSSGNISGRRVRTHRVPSSDEPANLKELRCMISSKGSGTKPRSKRSRLPSASQKAHKQNPDDPCHKSSELRATCRS